MERNLNVQDTIDSLPSLNPTCRRRPFGRTTMHFRNAYVTATRPCRDGLMTRQEMSRAIVDQAHGFPYSRKLEAHRSCVNALAFSSGDGRYLASGGDDRRICLWDFYQDDIKEPSFFLRGPTGNIFSLAFSATNRFLFSAGTSETILKYDVAYLGSSVTPVNRSADQVFQEHTDSIRAITCHPTQDDIFMSASEDGTIRHHDCRQPRTSMATQNLIATENEMTGVQHHPTMENLFVTSDGAGRVFLRDARMAFGPSTKRSNEGIVQRYNTKITSKSARHLSNPESSSVVFDREGSKLAVTFLHYLPTIYAVSDPDPLAVLSGNNLPDGTPNPPTQRTYSNSCTMKHGAFGGPGLDTDDMYAAGSDDFRAYVWKIPPLPQLKEQRKMFSADEWDACETSEIAFTESRQEHKTVPVAISTPLCRLTGHNSIVNTAIFHPHFMHVVTAGVERSIHLHSSTSSSPCTQNLPLSPPNVRQLKDETDGEDRATYLSALLGIQPLSVDSVEDSAERQTLSLFDHILREEGEADVFTRRPWRTPDSSESDDDEDDDEDMETESDSDSHSLNQPFSFLT